MRILILNGSPKGEASDTLHLTRAFVAGMNEAGENEVRLIHVIDRHIEYCRGCFSCKREGGICGWHDDMEEILAEILDSELIIWSFPLYCYGMPAPLKALIDRTMPLSTMAMRRVGDRYEHESRHDFSAMRYVMICGCGFPGSRNNFEGAVTQFRLMFGEEKSTILTVPESPMFNAPEAEPVTRPFLAVVRQAGREYGESKAITVATRQRLAIPMIPPEEYEKICNAE